MRSFQLETAGILRAGEIYGTDGGEIMIDPSIDAKIASLQKEITANVREIGRLRFVIDKETSELLALEAERDRIAALKTRVMDSEIQARVSYQGGRS